MCVRVNAVEMMVVIAVVKSEINKTTAAAATRTTTASAAAEETISTIPAARDRNGLNARALSSRT